MGNINKSVSIAFRCLYLKKIFLIHSMLTKSIKPEDYTITLIRMDTHGRLSVSLIKGDNISDLLFPFPYSMPHLR